MYSEVSKDRLFVTPKLLTRHNARSLPPEMAAASEQADALQTAAAGRAL